MTHGKCDRMVVLFTQILNHFKIYERSLLIKESRCDLLGKNDLHLIQI